MRNLLPVVILFYLPADLGADGWSKMLFTWDTTNLCIIFRQWRISGVTSLILSLLAVVALTAGYEFVREMSRQYEARHAWDGKGLSRK